MNRIFTPRQAQKVSTWAGGSTTELCIFPEDSTCAARNFAFRVSSATVELAESTFSDFTGYTRHIMPLEGHMDLWHEGVCAARLQPYQSHTFDGGQTTRSEGVCVDFNLIHVPDLRGKLHVVRNNGHVRCVDKGCTVVYARCDELVVSGEDRGRPFVHTLNRGDVLLLYGPMYGPQRGPLSCPPHAPHDERVPATANATASTGEREIQLATRQQEPVLAVIATVCGADGDTDDASDTTAYEPVHK